MVRVVSLLFIFVASSNVAWSQCYETVEGYCSDLFEGVSCADQDCTHHSNYNPPRWTCDWHGKKKQLVDNTISEAIDVGPSGDELLIQDSVLCFEYYYCDNNTSCQAANYYMCQTGNDRPDPSSYSYGTSYSGGDECFEY